MMTLLSCDVKLVVFCHWNALEPWKPLKEHRDSEPSWSVFRWTCVWNFSGKVELDSKVFFILIVHVKFDSENNTTSLKHIIILTYDFMIQIIFFCGFCSRTIPTRNKNLKIKVRKWKIILGIWQRWRHPTKPKPFAWEFQFLRTSQPDCNFF